MWISIRVSNDICVIICVCVHACLNMYVVEPLVQHFFFCALYLNRLSAPVALQSNSESFGITDNLPLLHRDGEYRNQQGLDIMSSKTNAKCFNYRIHSLRMAENDCGPEQQIVP